MRLPGGASRREKMSTIRDESTVASLHVGLRQGTVWRNERDCSSCDHQAACLHNGPSWGRGPR